MRRLISFSISLLTSAAALAQSPAPASAPDTPITAANVGEFATSELTTPQTTYWLGEVFPISHVVTAPKRAFQGLGGAYEWNSAPFNPEDWSRTTQADRGEKVVLTQTTRAYVSKSGPLTLPAGTQSLTLVTRIVSSAFNSFSTEKETEVFKLTSRTPNLTFRPLPAPAPGLFTGAVGDFALKSTASATEVKVGEAFTWTLQLSGRGNWPEIRVMPPRAVSKDFDYVTPVQKRNFASGVIFEGELSEDLLLVPTKVGTYQLGPVRFVYFNPKENKYQMLTSETLTVTVAAGASGATQTNASGQAGAAGERVSVPAAPPPLPLDPMKNGELGSAPIARSTLVTLCALMPALFVLYWLWLAARRRWTTDALAPRREAKAKISALIVRIEEDTTMSLTDLRFALFAWQRATAVLTDVTQTMPTPAQIAHAADAISLEARGTRWAQLWRESNQVIYGQATTVPATWAKRARDAVNATPLPGVPLYALLQRRNLFPALALIALALALPVSTRADAGSEAYRAGNFSAAEKTWAASAAQQPTDAALRYNLSLATAQQDRWTEAATHALAAFCLNPSSEQIRWQFKLSLDRSGIDHPRLTALANGTGFSGTARRFSPATWSRLAIFSCTLLAAALSFGAYASFNGRFRAQRRASYVVAALASFGGALSLASVAHYGELAERDIVVVAQPTLLASVPTEADTGQKTSPLPAGSLAKVDGHFLTWSHLKFSNGQTGWVQTKLVTSLYR